MNTNSMTSSLTLVGSLFSHGAEITSNSMSDNELLDKKCDKKISLDRQFNDSKISTLKSLMDNDDINHFIYACENKNLDSIKLIIEHIPLNESMVEYVSPRVNSKILSFLLSKVKCNDYDKLLNSCLKSICENCRNEDSNETYESVSMLIERYAKLDDSIIELMIKTGKIKLFNLIINDYGIKIREKYVLMAAKYDQIDLMKQLRSHFIHDNINTTYAVSVDLARFKFCKDLYKVTSGF